MKRENLVVGEAVELIVGRLNCKLPDQILIQEILNRAVEMGFEIYDLNDPIENPPKPVEDCQRKEECQERQNYTSHIIDCLCRYKTCWCPVCLHNTASGLEKVLCAGLWLEDSSGFAAWDDFRSREDREFCVCVCREAMNMAADALEGIVTEGDNPHETSTLLH